MDPNREILSRTVPNRPQLRPTTVVQYQDCSASSSPPEWFEERLRGETNLKYHLTNSSRITHKYRKMIILTYTYTGQTLSTMKSMKETNNIFLKFGIPLFTEPSALKYVGINVNRHSCLLAFFHNYATYT